MISQETFSLELSGHLTEVGEAQGGTANEEVAGNDVELVSAWK